MVEQIDIVDVVIKKEQETALTLPAQARSFTVATGEQYQRAADFLLVNKAMKKKIEEHHNPIIEAANKTHKLAVAAKKKFTDPIDEAERIIKPKMAAYVDAQEAKRRKEQERLELEARAKAEKEAMKRAKAAEKAGDAELAAQILDEAVSAPPVVTVESTVPQVKGISTAKIWTYRIDNIEKMSRLFLMANDQKIRDTIKAMGKDAEKLVGEGSITVWQETSMRGSKG